jgi:hypothetical protein
MLVSRYKSVNFGLEKSPGSPNWWVQIDCNGISYRDAEAAEGVIWQEKEQRSLGLVLVFLLARVWGLGISLVFLLFEKVTSLNPSERRYKSIMIYLRFGFIQSVGLVVCPV